MSALAQLRAAVAAGNATIVADLLAAEPTLAGARDEQGVSLLLAALYRNDRASVTLLRAGRHDLDIFEAAALGEEAQLALLLQQTPALAHAHAADGFTALHLAAFFRQEAAAGALLAAGAAAGAVAENPSRVQPLHSAAAAQSAAICALLLDAGADVNARQQGGFTPLHAAAQHRDLPLLRLLLAHGADPVLTTDDGRSTRDLAAGDATTLALLDQGLSAAQR